MTDDRSLQPDNRSGLQTALEKILDNAMDTIEAEAPFRTLLFPMQAPKQFLPSLAIERGVQDWAATDTENAIR
ncbi:phage tail protein, partial [Citrobacter portucalensis]